MAALMAIMLVTDPAYTQLAESCKLFTRSASR